MPQEAWSDKRERQYEHIKESAKEQGASTERAKEIAARTVNKERARSGEASESSRTSRQDMSSSRRGGLRSGVDALPAHLLVIERDGLVFGHSNLFGKCAYKIAGVDSAGQYRKIVRLDGLKKARADASRFRYVIQRDAALLAPPLQFFAQSRHTGRLTSLNPASALN